ncbi:MAG: putative sulfate exporter family transporter [Bacteroides sp.]|nr:putative sulfate exporter family transporter [Bacteroides sp.]
MLSMKKYARQVYIALVVAISLLLLIDYLPNVDSYVSPPIALFLGLLFALLFGQAYPKFNKKVSKKLLQYSVVGLGFGMNLQASLQSGKEGMAFTIVSVVGTMLIGWIIGRKLLKVERDTSYLISSGTAICGGSAIAAVGPVLKAKDTEMSVALGTVFILNAIALFVFPVIGHALDMTQQQFGMWAAIAIHDTSSVVGAGAAYGEEALQVATTIKLTRALWIIPLALVTSFIFKNKGQKISIPWFILFFVLAMIFNTYVLSTTEVGTMIGHYINDFARKSLTITLFFIGASLSSDVLKSVGIKPLIQGVLLWIIISLSTLAYIYCI